MLLGCAVWISFNPLLFLINVAYALREWGHHRPHNPRLSRPRCSSAPTSPSTSLHHLLVPHRGQEPFGARCPSEGIRIHPARLDLLPLLFHSPQRGTLGMESSGDPEGCEA